MKRRHGFTLIELLVVVSIIALLIAILLPSLGRAKKNASRTRCLSQLRQIAISTRAYGAGNDDLLPEVSGAAGTGNFKQALLTTYAAASASPTDAGFAIGRLYSTGYVKDIRIAWDPDQKDPQFSLNNTNAPAPFPSGYATGSRYRSSYDFLANHTADLNVAYTKVSQMPIEWQPTPAGYAGQGPLIALDLIQNAVESAHTDGNATPMWNVVYSDGHALSVKAAGVQNQLNAWYNPATGAGGIGNSWARFDQMVALLLQGASSGQTMQ